MEDEFKDTDYTTEDKEPEYKTEEKQPEHRTEDKESELFASMNKVSEGDSNLFRNGMLGILLLIIIFMGKMCAQYAMRDR